MNDLISEFSNNIFLYLTGKQKSKKCMLVKRHTENLQSHGEFSFVNTVKSWFQHISVKESTEDTFLKAIGKKPDDLVDASKPWSLLVSKVKEDKDRIYIFIDRHKGIKIGLSNAIKNLRDINERLKRDHNNVSCDPSCSDIENLTYLRLQHLASTVKNLCEVCADESPNVFVTYKSSSNSTGAHKVLCGVVLNAKTGVKEDHIKGSDFISLRQNEMLLIAQHKYGVRVSSDTKWKDFINHLGESAATFELLQIKPSSPIRINFDNASAGSSKGASFVLYNCARLETMLRTYQEKVEEGTYPPLPEMDEVDVSLLSNEEEWNLIFNYIISLPSLLHSCIEISMDKCEFRPHNVCTFLSSMVRVFSQYYRRVRILTEPRKHLLPVMFARIYMLRVLNDTLKVCLRILNIRTVTQM